jgi:hypothetical protein
VSGDETTDIRFTDTVVLAHDILPAKIWRALLDSLFVEASFGLVALCMAMGKNPTNAG